VAALVGLANGAAPVAFLPVGFRSAAFAVSGFFAAGDFFAWAEEAAQGFFPAFDVDAADFVAAFGCARTTDFGAGFIAGAESFAAGLAAAAAVAFLVVFTAFGMGSARRVGGAPSLASRPPATR
jgi:hypothetical protein